MVDQVPAHYSSSGGLAEAIVEDLRSAGKDLSELQATDLETVDEFLLGGRKSALELAVQMNLSEETFVRDIGSGLGGPTRSLAGTYGCHVTGNDLTQVFCNAAEVLSDWVNLKKRVAFQQRDATSLPLAVDNLDAAMTIQALMNLPAKDKVC